MNSQHETKKVSKNDLFQCGFWRTMLANTTAMYLEHPQQIKKTRFYRSQEKFFVAAFLIRNLCLKIFGFFWFNKIAKFMKKVKKLNLIQYWIKYWMWKSTFTERFHQQEKFWNHLLDSTLRESGQKSFHPVYLFCSDCQNLLIKAGQKSSRLFFYPVPAVI